MHREKTDWTRCAALLGALLGAAVSAPAQAQEKVEAVVAALLQRGGVAVASRRLPEPPRGAASSAPANTNASMAASSASPALAVGLMVRMTTAAGATAVPAALQSALQSAGTPLRYDRQDAAGTHVLKFGAPLSVPQARAAAARLRAVAGVTAVDLDLKLQTRTVRPNDAYFPAQHSLVTPANYPGAIDAVRAWQVTTGSPNTVIAFVDTGITQHREFQGRVLPGYDFVSNSARGSDGDGRDGSALDTGSWVTAADAAANGCSESASTWHGTHMAGIAAASGNNASGLAGINWQARILPVRALGKCGGAASDVIDGMLWAAGVTVPGVPANAHPAKVINMSLGVHSPDGCPAAFQAAIDQVRARGAVVVVPAGNERDDAARYAPAACDGVVTVAAVDMFGNLASYSNSNTSGRVTIAAPGGEQANGGGAMVLSTSNSGTSTPGAESVAWRQGTSVATAHVSGVLSLALAVHPQLSVPELTALLKLTSHGFGPNSACTKSWPLCGAGIANAANLVHAAAALRPYAVVAESRLADTERFFRASGVESTALEDGSQGRWLDTADSFVAWRDGTTGALPVCRLYHPRHQAHFYTVDTGECERLKAQGEWRFQNIAFHAHAASRGICPQGTSPVVRYTRLDGSNVRRHRYTAHRGVTPAAVVAQGWQSEGAVFCGVAV
jgi:serine protease